MTAHIHTDAQCGTDHRDCLRAALASKIAYELAANDRDGEYAEIGAYAALAHVAQRDPEAMAAVGLAVDDAMARKAASQLTFTIPDSCWISGNRQAVNNGHLARVRADLQLIAAATARRMEPIGCPVHADWEVRYGKGGTPKADPVNAAAVVTKGLMDGLVRCGLLLDDSPQFVLSERFWRGPNLDHKGHQIVLTLTP